MWQWIFGENGMIKLPKKSDDNLLDGVEYLELPQNKVFKDYL
jgi:hypothetical protein